MAVVRHFALNLVRQVNDKRSIKRRRKRASWDHKYLLEIFGAAAMLTSTRCLGGPFGTKPDPKTFAFGGGDLVSESW
jgi:hypothetical protein